LLSACATDVGEAGSPGDESRPLAESAAAQDDTVLVSQSLEVLPKDGVWSNPGPYVVGTRRVMMPISPKRSVPVQLWYPAGFGASLLKQTIPTSGLDPAGSAQQTTSAGLFANEPLGCSTKRTSVAQNYLAATRSEKWPLVLFSHCMGGARFAMLSAAEHLASLGFVVAAPDHLGSTIYDTTPDKTFFFLETRVSDIVAVLDRMLSGSATEVPSELRTRIDPARVGMFGHSMGAVTTGLVLSRDRRVSAGALLGAPVRVPLIAGADPRKITQPGMFIEAAEDSSIGAIGNGWIESDYKAFPNEKWGFRMADAGHWSFTDVAGLKTFESGCGTGKRLASPNPTFTYLNNETARTLTKSYLAAFFAYELNGSASGKAFLDSAPSNSAISRLPAQ
jgi:predicted dienelactone hydrolase